MSPVGYGTKAPQGARRKPNKNAHLVLVAPSGQEEQEMCETPQPQASISNSGQVPPGQPRECDRQGLPGGADWDYPDLYTVPEYIISNAAYKTISSLGLLHCHINNLAWNLGLSGLGQEDWTRYGNYMRRLEHVQTAGSRHGARSIIEAIPKFSTPGRDQDTVVAALVVVSVLGVGSSCRI